jgi:hypothetical protein
MASLKVKLHLDLPQIELKCCVLQVKTIDQILSQNLMNFNKTILK